MTTNPQSDVRVYGFKQTFDMVPVRGDPMSGEKVDAKGYRINEHGIRLMQREAIDWVIFGPPGVLGTSTNVERVKHMIPDEDKLGSDPANSKLKIMKARWEAIRPHYEAWKQGNEVPNSGTPLAAWPGLIPEQVEAFRRMGVRSVEELRDLADSQVDKIQLPNVRELRKQAALFIENLGASAAAEREAQKDEIIARMQQQIADMQAALASNKPSATAAAAAVPTADDELASLRAELDAKGIVYDGRWAAPKLRALLQANGEEQAA